jgi:hypothetical protein
MEKRFEGTWRFIGEFLGVLAIITFIATLIGIRQSNQASNAQDSAQATQITLLQEQLNVQREIATLQAGSSGIGPTSTIIAQRILELESTRAALATAEAKVRQTSQSEPSSTPPANTEAIALPIPVGELLFNEDFEDGIANGFVINGSMGKVTVDENNNYVYEVDNSSLNAFVGASFGSSEWKNYSLSYRVKLVDFNTNNDAPLATMTFSSNAIALTPFYKSIGLVDTYYSTNWISLAGLEYTFTKNEWMNILVQTKDNNIKVSLNGKLIMGADDKLVRSRGAFSLSTAPQTIVKFDDIQVSSLGQ